jgi:DNA polymerase III subunit epsilon
MSFEKLAFVDIETTGGSLYGDRIVEIAVLRVENFKVVKKFQTLINPQRYLPPSIVDITGIDPSELDKSPTFEDIAPQLLEILEGCKFVAHNVRFDYSFIKNELKRLGINFSQKHFCTVKLSRRLFPEHKHHNLDVVIERCGFKIKRRHRAFDDAEVLYKFYKLAKKQFGEEALLQAVADISKQPSLPVHLASNIPGALPKKPGVYIFYGPDQMPLYVGKSINIRQRVLSHFQNDHSSSSEMKIAQQIASIETIQTAGELGALLKESDLVKSLQPLYNRKLRKSRALMVLKRSEQNSFASVNLELAHEIHPEEIETIFGTFKSKRQAENTLMAIADENQLCRKLLGVEKTTRHCFGYSLGKCRGACIGEESPSLYNLRFEMAFAKMKLVRWPFQNPIVIREDGSSNDSGDGFVIDKWCYIGKVEYNSEGREVIARPEVKFDLDIYKIIRSFIHSPKNMSKISEIPYKEFLRMQQFAQ